MLRTHLAAFIRHLQTEKRYSPHTLTAYGKDIERAADFFLETYEIDDAAALSHFHIRSWLAALRADGLEARSLNRKISSLSSFFKFLMRESVLEKNPARQVKALRTPERLPQYLNDSEGVVMHGETHVSD